MKVRKRKLEGILTQLKDVKRTSTMKNANFHLQSMDAKYPTNRKEVTPFIEETTRLWRQTWITEPLQEIIKEIEFEMNR